MVGHNLKGCRTANVGQKRMSASFLLKVCFPPGSGHPKSARQCLLCASSRHGIIRDGWRAKSVLGSEHHFPVRNIGRHSVAVPLSPLADGDLVVV